MKTNLDSFKQWNKFILDRHRKNSYFFWFELIPEMIRKFFLEVFTIKKPAEKQAFDLSLIYVVNA
jgi:hypothetical protein